MQIEKEVEMEMEREREERERGKGENIRGNEFQYKVQNETDFQH